MQKNNQNDQYYHNVQKAFKQVIKLPRNIDNSKGFVQILMFPNLLNEQRESLSVKAHMISKGQFASYIKMTDIMSDSQLQNATSQQWYLEDENYIKNTLVLEPYFIVSDGQDFKQINDSANSEIVQQIEQNDGYQHLQENIGFNQARGKYVHPLIALAYLGHKKPIYQIKINEIVTSINNMNLGNESRSIQQIQIDDRIEINQESKENNTEFKQLLQKINEDHRKSMAQQQEQHDQIVKQLKEQIGDHKTNNSQQKQTVEQHKQAVEQHKQTIEQQKQLLEQQKQAVEQHKQTIEQLKQTTKQLKQTTKQLKKGVKQLKQTVKQLKKAIAKAQKIAIQKDNEKTQVQEFLNVNIQGNKMAENCTSAIVIYHLFDKISNRYYNEISALDNQNNVIIWLQTLIKRAKKYKGSHFEDDKDDNLKKSIKDFQICQIPFQSTPQQIKELEDQAYKNHIFYLPVSNPIDFIMDSGLCVKSDHNCRKMLSSYRKCSFEQLKTLVQQKLQLYYQKHKKCMDKTYNVGILKEQNGKQTQIIFLQFLKPILQQLNPEIDIENVDYKTKTNIKDIYMFLKEKFINTQDSIDDQDSDEDFDDEELEYSKNEGQIKSNRHDIIDWLKKYTSSQ